MTSGENYIFLGTHEGMACRFKESDVRPMGRPARGVRGMELEEGDYLVGVEIVEKDGSSSPFPKTVSASELRSSTTASPPAAAKASSI